MVKSKLLLKLLGKLRNAYSTVFTIASNVVAFLRKRTRVLKIVFALVAVMFLSGILSGFMLAQVLSATQISSTLSNQGTVKTVGVGVYWDPGLANRTTVLEWGLLDPGSQKSFTVYIRNEGNSAVTLSQTTSNWNPTATSNYVTLNWNYNGQQVNSGGSVQVTFTLATSSNVNGIGTFSFDVTIVGSG
jgi:hypothetical protein